MRREESGSSVQSALHQHKVPDVADPFESRSESEVPWHWQAACSIKHNSTVPCIGHRPGDVQNHAGELQVLV